MNNNTPMNLKDILLEIELEEPVSSPFIYSVVVPVSLHIPRKHTWYEPVTIEELTKDKIEFRGRRDIITRMTDWFTDNKDSVWDKRPLPREIYSGKLERMVDVVGVWTPLGKVSWKEETGSEYNIEVGSKLLSDAIDHYQGVQGQWKIYYIIYPPHPLSKEKLDRKSSEGINLKWDILENILLPSSIKFLNKLKNTDKGQG